VDWSYLPGGTANKTYQEQAVIENRLPSSEMLLDQKLLA